MPPGDIYSLPLIKRLSPSQIHFWVKITLRFTKLIVHSRSQKTSHFSPQPSELTPRVFPREGSFLVPSHFSKKTCKTCTGISPLTLMLNRVRSSYFNTSDSKYNKVPLSGQYFPLKVVL